MRHPDPDNFGFLIADVTRLFRAEVDRRIGDTGSSGLTPGDGRTLSYVARAGDVCQNVLAERMAVEAMTLSLALDRLEARGLVERRQDPDDRRAKRVDLTAAGEAALAEIRQIVVGVLADISQNFEPAEWRRLLETLRRIRANLADIRGQAAQRDGAVA